MAQTRTKTSLSESHPDLAAQWHPTKNGDLAPEQVTFGSAKKIWWVCTANLGHPEWSTSVYVRTRGSGCPQCFNEHEPKVPYETSLERLYPEIAESWHVDKNYPVTPSHVSPGTHTKYAWVCLDNPNHDPWVASVKARIPKPPANKGTGCPECAGKKISYRNSLEAIYPAVAASFHPTLNGSKKPSDVHPDSNPNYWWICLVDSEHQPWKRSPRVHRKNINAGCIECNSLAIKAPDIAASWHPERFAHRHHRLQRWLSECHPEGEPRATPTRSGRRSSDPTSCRAPP